MARTGVTREQVFETADALIREGQTPTVLSVRTRLGGGSPNTITPLLAEWRTLHEQKQAASLPPVPEPVEVVLRQVWGAAWQQAQSLLTDEREALAAARKAVEQERAEMLTEIGRLDEEIEAAKEDARQMREILETERRTHEQTRSDAREARAVAQERGERIAAQDAAVADLRCQLDTARQELNTCRIEVATLTERAAHAEELRAMVRRLQERQGGEAS